MDELGDRVRDLPLELGKQSRRKKESGFLPLVNAF